MKLKQALPETNRVAVYYSNREHRLETRPVPTIGPGELLVEVRASGICGSDIMEWYRRSKASTVLGHEIAGRIIATGGEVNQFEVDDRVVVTHHVPCMVCRYCRTGRHTVCETLRLTNIDPGGFAQFIRVPTENVERGVLKLPTHVSYEEGSVVEPLACALRGQRKAGLDTGDTAVIIGAGTSGCLHLLSARVRGVSRIIMTDISPERRAFAESLGADLVLDGAGDVPEQVRCDLGHGADCVIVTTGNRKAIAQALETADRGAVVLFFAPMGPDEEYPLPFDDVFWRNDVTLTSSYGACLADLAQALTLIESGRVDVTRLITHRLGLAEIQKGFELMVEARDSLKIVVDPGRKGSPNGSR